MLGKLLNNWHQDQSHKAVADVSMFDDPLKNIRRLLHTGKGLRRVTYINLLRKEHGHEGYERDTNNDSDESLGKRKLRLEQVLVPIMVLLLIGLQDIFVQAVMRPYLEPHVYAESQ